MKNKEMLKLFFKKYSDNYKEINDSFAIINYSYICNLNKTKFISINVNKKEMLKNSRCSDLFLNTFKQGKRIISVEINSNNVLTVKYFSGSMKRKILTFVKNISVINYNYNKETNSLKINIPSPFQRIKNFEILKSITFEDNKIIFNETDKVSLKEFFSLLKKSDNITNVYYTRKEIKIASGLKDNKTGILKFFFNKITLYMKDTKIEVLTNNIYFFNLDNEKRINLFINRKFVIQEDFMGRLNYIQLNKKEKENFFNIKKESGEIIRCFIYTFIKGEKVLCYISGHGSEKEYEFYNLKNKELISKIYTKRFYNNRYSNEFHDFIFKNEKYKLDFEEFETTVKKIILKMKIDDLKK